MNTDGEDEYDIPVDQMDALGEGVDAFANVGQGLEGDHKTEMLQYWQQIIDDIERISDDGTDTDVFKSTVLPLARIKKVMKTDSEVRMISAEAPILFAKGCDVFITELTMRAWIHAEENKRRTLQRSDIATAIQKSDVFDFLIDIVPREEAQPRRTSHRAVDQHETSMPSVSHQSGNLPGNASSMIPPQVPQGQLPGQLPGQLHAQPHGHNAGQIHGPIHGQQPGQLPSQMGQLSGQIPHHLSNINGRPMSGTSQDTQVFPSGMQGSIPNLGALSGITNLNNLNGMELSGINLANASIPYDQAPVPQSLSYAPGTDLQFTTTTHGHTPDSSQEPQKQIPRSLRHQQQRLQQQEQPESHTPTPTPTYNQHSQQHQQQQQQQQPHQQQLVSMQPLTQSSIRSSPNHVHSVEPDMEDRPKGQVSPKQTEVAEGSRSPRNYRHPSKDTSPHYGNGEEQFTSYPSGSVDVSAYEQNF